MAEIKALPATLTITNTYSAEAEIEKVWNTGCVASGFPHADELAVDNAAIIEAVADFAAKHIASIQIYKTNQFVQIVPGDVLKIKVDDAAAVAYYKEFVAGNADLKFEAAYVEG